MNRPPWGGVTDQVLPPPHRVHIAGSEYEKDLSKFEQTFHDEWPGGHVVSRLMESIDGQLEESPPPWTLFEGNKVRMSVREHRDFPTPWVEVRASCQTMTASGELYAWLRRALFLRSSAE